MTKFKRLLSVVLTVCMLASMFSMTFGLNIFAADNSATSEASQTFTFDEAGLNDFLGKTYTKSAKATGAVANPKFTSITDEATLSSYGADQWGLTNLLKVAADKDDTARFSFFANSADYDSAKSIHEAVKQTNAPKSMSTYFSHNTGAETNGTKNLKNSLRGIITGAKTDSSAYEDAENGWTGTKYVTTFYVYAVAPVYVNGTVKLMIRNFNRNITEIEYDETSIAAGAVNTITHPTNAQVTGAGTVELTEAIEGVTSQDQLNPLMKLELKYTGDDAKAVEIAYTGKYTVDSVTKEFTGTLTDSNAAATDRVFGFWENDVWYHAYAAPAFGETTVNYDVAAAPCTHENTELQVITPATCTENGVGKKVCKDCGETVEENVVIEATGHKWATEYTTDTPATCTKEGQESIHCTVCDAIKEDSIKTIEKAAHEYGEWTETVPATCTTKGEEKRTCKNCDAFETRETKEIGHDYEAVVTEPTCTEQGYTTYTCKNCKDTYVDDYVPAAHKLGEWEVSKEATVDEPGEEVQKCTVCGEIINRRETGKATTGFSTKDGKTYYYENGNMVKGFKEIDGKTYYFKQDTGVMYKNTLALIGGKLYSFDKDGSLNTNDSHYEITDDKCYFDGIQVTGWQTINGNKYYFSPKTGKMFKNYIGLVASTVGSFNENGVYTADENLTIKGQKCYAVTDTTYSNPLTGWQTIYGKQFYFRKTGAMAGNIIVDATKETSKALIGGQIYTFTKAGYLLGE